MPHLLKAMFGELNPWGKFWLYLGLASLAAAAGMSFAVGWKMTALHAVFLACLSFVTAFIPEVAYRMWNERKRGVAIALSLCAMPLFVIEFGQHAAYTAGIRGHDLATTRVQNVKHTGAQNTVSDQERQIAFWETRLAGLINRNGWTATVTADALRAKLEGLNLAIKLEAEKRGCKDKCLARTRERDEVASRIAVLEETKDLSGKIADAKAALAELRDKAGKVEFRSSQTEHMNAFLSKAVAIFGQGTVNVDAVTEEVTQQSANLAMALAGTGLPALALFIAGLYRRQEDETPTSPKANPVDQPHVAVTRGFMMPSTERATAPARPITFQTETIADLRRKLAGVRMAA